MDEEKRKLQRAILSIAVEIKRICELYNIPYFINSGTQLGAVRHRGFIPWDDDFDIGMKRKDYEHFLKICDRELDKSKYFLQTEDTEPYYAFCFGKIQLKNTNIIEEFSKNVPIQHSIFVDIFPYDNLPDNSLIRKLFLFQNHLIKNLLWVKCGYGEEFHKKKRTYKILKVLSRFISKERLKEIRKRLLRKYNSLKTRQCFSGDYPGERLMNSWFDSLVDYEFETEFFKGFEKYDEYLSRMYGNYMELPPVEQRVTHTTVKVEYGPYNDYF